ncbi:DUF1080 domain-containing protein [Halalkalibaculum sp. DA3122]
MMGLLATGFTTQAVAQSDNGWISLFDGHTLDGWKASENPETFSVKEGRIVVDGPRAHLFYQGPVNDHNFRDFEFKADVMTTEGSNSGIFFHTQYQEEGWPSKGYEAQINNSYDKDPRRTASLYGVDDIKETPFPDNEWFTMHITVEGNRIVIKVDGKTMVDYTEPENVDRGENVLSSGTFALQGHDPGSLVYFKNIRVKPL